MERLRVVKKTDGLFLIPISTKERENVGETRMEGVSISNSNVENREDRNHLRQMKAANPGRAPSNGRKYLGEFTLNPSIDRKTAMPASHRDSVAATKETIKVKSSRDYMGEMDPIPSALMRLFNSNGFNAFHGGKAETNTCDDVTDRYFGVKQRKRSKLVFGSKHVDKCARLQDDGMDKKFVACAGDARSGPKVGALSRATDEKKITGKKEELTRLQKRKKTKASGMGKRRVGGPKKNGARPEGGRAERNTGAADVNREYDGSNEWTGSDSDASTIPAECDIADLDSISVSEPPLPIHRRKPVPRFPRHSPSTSQTATYKPLYPFGPYGLPGRTERSHFALSVGAVIGSRLGSGAKQR